MPYAGGLFLLMNVIIMAGGKGTRITSVASDIPKPMIRVNGKPILTHQIECLARNNFTNITIVTGHLASCITNYFGDGSDFGVSITYYEEHTPLGTAGALFKLYEKLGDDFLLINGDIIFDMDLRRLLEFHYEKKALATLVSHPNNHPYDSGLLVTDNTRRVTAWLSKEDTRLYYKNEVNAGIHVLSKKIIAGIHCGKEKVDLDRDILKPALVHGGVFAYTTPEYIKDMGTPERYNEVTKDIQNGLVFKKNLTQSQRAVFMDRDGTINEMTGGFVKRPEDFTLIPGAAEAVRKINADGLLSIVITNQPVSARGDLNFETLYEIHNKMETELGKEGAYLDDIFFCPHHPDSGYPNERAEYKIACECRKPKPGMILAAAKKYNIDLKASWMTGDSWRDIEAGRAAGCKTAFLTGNENTPEHADIVCQSLAEFVNCYIQ
jgi:D-glycero-D-manno-heptose 1,7-bisphosphate phosphatase